MVTFLQFLLTVAAASVGAAASAYIAIVLAGPRLRRERAFDQALDWYVRMVRVGRRLEFLAGDAAKNPGAVALDGPLDDFRRVAVEAEVFASPATVVRIGQLINDEAAADMDLEQLHRFAELTTDAVVEEARAHLGLEKMPSAAELLAAVEASRRLTLP